MPSPYFKCSISSLSLSIYLSISLNYCLLSGEIPPYFNGLFRGEPPFPYSAFQCFTTSVSCLFLSISKAILLLLTCDFMFLATVLLTWEYVLCGLSRRFLSSFARFLTSLTDLRMISVFAYSSMYSSSIFEFCLNKYYLSSKDCWWRRASLTLLCAGDSARNSLLLGDELLFGLRCYEL